MSKQLAAACKDCSNYNSLVKRLLFFKNVSQNILEKKPLDELLNEIITSSKRLLNAEASSLLLYDEVENNLYFHTVAGQKKKELTARRLNIGEGIAGWVAETKKPLKIDDCYIDERFNKEFDIKTGFKTKNMICVPMIRKNKLIGVIQVINKNGGAPFNEEDVDIFKVLGSECALAIENARLNNMELRTEQLRYELSVAHEIQQKLLPNVLPHFEDIDFKTILTPAREVGGDYFNILQINKNETLIIVADVSGKSIPAAMIVSTIYSFIHTYFIINKGEFNLVAFVEAFNRFLISSTTADKFATAWFGLYNHKERELESVNAGHNPTLILRQGNSDVELLKTGGLLLGGLELPYESEVIHLYKNDLIVFYTDGIPEAMNKLEEEYGEERFEILLKNHRELQSEFITNKVLEDIHLFCDGAEQSDDITCGILKIK